MSVTIALSSPSKAFNKLLLPALGLPIIDVLIPSFIILPFLLSFRICSICSFRLVIFGINTSLVIISTSSYSG